MIFTRPIIRFWTTTGCRSNKNYKIKEDLSQVHLQNTLDYPKTYYVSALERVKKHRRQAKNQGEYDTSDHDYQLPPPPPVDFNRLDFIKVPRISKFSPGKLQDQLEITSDNRPAGSVHETREPIEIDSPVLETIPSNRNQTSDEKRESTFRAKQVFMNETDSQTSVNPELKEKADIFLKTKLKFFNSRERLKGNQQLKSLIDNYFPGKM